MLGGECHPCCDAPKPVGMATRDFGPTLNTWNFAGGRNGSTATINSLSSDWAFLGSSAKAGVSQTFVALDIRTQGDSVLLRARFFSNFFLPSGLRCRVFYSKARAEFDSQLSAGVLTFTQQEAYLVENPDLGGGVTHGADIADAGTIAIVVDPPQLQFLGKSYRIRFDTVASEFSIVEPFYGHRCVVLCSPGFGMEPVVQCPGGEPDTSTHFPEAIKGKDFEFEFGGSGFCNSNFSNTYNCDSKVSFGVPAPGYLRDGFFFIGFRAGRQAKFTGKSQDASGAITCRCEDITDTCGLGHSPLLDEQFAFFSGHAPLLSIHEMCWVAFSDAGVLVSGRMAGNDITYSPMRVITNPYGCIGPTPPLQTYYWNPMSFRIEQFEGPAQQYGLLELGFSSCFGRGASGTAQAPQFGPITAVTLTRPGSGYAKLGRRQPTLSIAGASATFSLTQQLGSCDLPYWSIASISVSPGAVGFADGQSLSVTASAGDTVEVAAQGTITTQRAEPSLNAAASAGSGAVFSVATANNGDGTWRVDSVTFTGTTAGYLDGDYLAFSGTGVTEEQAAYARIITGRIEPTVAVSVQSYAGGSGAVLTPTLTAGTAWHDGRPIWSVSSLTLTAAGSGYEVGDFISAAATDGQQDPYYYFYGVVEGVDSGGGISAYSIYDGGGFFKSDGFISSVVVDDGGRYYADEIASITLTNGGRYYREDAALSPFVASVSVSVIQPADGIGSGAVVTASVNSDTSSPEFGHLSALTIVNGGINYTDRKYVGACDTNPFP